MGGKTNTWRLNNMPLKSKWAREKLKRRLKKYVETNENKSTIFQKL